MPVVYRCRRCGAVLYVFRRVGQDSYGVPTPSELASWYGGFCPRCGAPLGKPRLHDVVVKPNGFEELESALADMARTVGEWRPWSLELRRARRALEKTVREAGLEL